MLGFGELNRMIATENILIAYQSRKASDNWGQWGQDHPDLEKILIDAELINARPDHS